MNLTELLIDQYWERVGGELHVGGLPISEIANHHGTPLFVYDRGLLDRRLDLLRSAFPTDFDIYYSIKANPNLAILTRLVSRGCGLEVASAGELAHAMAAHCPIDRIIFAGPGKTDRELETAVRYGIGEIHIESFNEALRIAALCKRLGVKARVAVRVNPAGGTEGGAMRMGGRALPFGIDEEELSPLVEYVRSTPDLELCGVHVFAGTQILDHSVLIAQYRKAVAIARALVMQTGSPLATVDLGGGLGIPYFAEDSPLDLDRLRTEVASLISEIRKDSKFEGTRFLIEPGRFVVGESGIYVARIVDIKESRGKKFLILDGGLNHHLAASGNLGQTIKRNFPIVILERLDQPVEETVDVVGPLCTPLDTLGRGLRVASPAVGDLVGILQSGAYALSASPVNFLSHPAPAEVWVEEGNDLSIGARGTAEDEVQHSQLPSISVAGNDTTSKESLPTSPDGELFQY